MRSEHRRLFGKRHADRLKAVYLLGSGWSRRPLPKPLLIDNDTVHNHFKRYQDYFCIGTDKFNSKDKPRSVLMNKFHIV